MRAHKLEADYKWKRNLDLFYIHCGSRRYDQDAARYDPEPLLYIGGGGRTSDDVDEFGGDDGLTGAVVDDLVLVDHVTGVL